LSAEEPDQGRNPFSGRRLGYVSGRFDSKYRHAAFDEILEEVPVVTRYFHHETLLVKAQLSDHLLAVMFRVFKPRVRVGREVWIVGKNAFRALVLFELHKKAFLADISMKWIIDLSTIEVLRRRISFAEWGHA
jgi:hypothetical protein